MLSGTAGSSGGSDSKLIRLRFRGREIILPPGRYIIGRVPTCEIVIDEPLVSRHHAELNVGHDSASIRDLDSVNGVFVNGSVITASCVLSHGDRIGIGRQEIEFLIGGAAPGDSDKRPQVNLTDVPNSAPVYQVERASPSSKPPPPSLEPTKQADALELLSVVADRALDSGRGKQAEDMLRAHLVRVLEGAKAGRAIPDATADAAVHYAIRLAAATGNAAWIDYALELLTVRRTLCPPGELQALKAALELLPGIDLSRFEQYTKSLRSPHSGLHHYRMIQAMEELMAHTKSKRE